MKKSLLAILVSLVTILVGCTTVAQSPLISPTATIQSETVSETTSPLTLPSPQSKMSLGLFTPYFLDDPGINLNGVVKVQYYGEPNLTLPVEQTKGEMIQVSSEEDGLHWIPVWYGTSPSKNIKLTSATRITLNKDAEPSLFPNSQTRKKGVDASVPLYSVLRWDDWYGVLLSPTPAYQEYKTFRPLLLWVNKKDISKQEEIKAGLFEKSSAIPAIKINEIIEAALYKGIDASSVQQLLGKPHFIESSRNMDINNGPVQLALTWRYELEDGQAKFTFSKDKKLLERTIITPMTKTDQSVLNGYMYPEDQLFEYRFLKLAPTIEPNWEWRSQHWLGFNFLYAALDDVLLVKGDDGYFSGMHDNSDLYALNKTTGKLLWQVKAGHSGFTAFLDTSRKAVTISTPFNPETKKYAQRVQHIRLSDGKLIWKYNLPDENEFLFMARAKDSVLLYSRSDDNLDKHKLVVLNVATGKQMWSKNYDEPFKIYNRSENDPYILIEIGDRLQALQPKTGKMVWSIKVNGKKEYWEGEDYTSGLFKQPMNPLGSDLTERWMLLGSQQVLLNVKTGKVLRSYEVIYDDLVFPLDKRFLMIQKKLTKSNDTDEDQYETHFYDTNSGKTLWTLPGRVFKPIIEGDVVYVTVNGVPSAINKMNGQIIWQLQTNVSSPSGWIYGFGTFTIVKDYVLLPYNSDLLLFDKKSGKNVKRITDVMFGYPELGDQDVARGYINYDGKDLYVGSYNGYFSKFQLPEMKP